MWLFYLIYYLYKGMREIYITEAQHDFIRDFIKETSRKNMPSAQDQVNNKVNAGIMYNITGGGMYEGAEPESDNYNIGFEGDSNLEYGHVFEGIEKDFDYKTSIKSLLDYMSSEGLNIKPYPKIVLNHSEQDGLFIKTGYYSPSEKKVVVFIQKRHPKDILRSFAHEIIHHMQNLEGKDMNFTNADDVKDNEELEKLESEAYLKGNIYFRKWTEYERQNEHSVIKEWFINEKSLINENIIKEGVSPIVYHFTSVHSLYKIILSDKFYLKTGAFKKFADAGDGKRMFYLSTTRNKNGHEGYSNRFVCKGGVRITLDGDKLNQRYHGSSFNYWGDEELGRMKYLNPEKVGLNKNWSQGMRYHREDETEDRVWSYRASIPNAWNYILSVDICISGIEKDEKLKQIVFNIFNTSRKFSEKINLYDDVESFALGNKNTVVPDWLKDYNLYANFKQTQNNYSSNDNVLISMGVSRMLASALALMTYFEPNANKNNKIVEYCNKYGFKKYLNSELFSLIKRNYNVDITSLADELDNGGDNREEESNIRDMVSHWMRKNNYSTIKDILKKYEMPQYLEEGGKWTIYAPMVDESIEPEDVDLTSFNIKKNLNPKFWKDGKLDSRIRMKLLDIADDFIEYLGVNWVKPEDITITGSLANYNWNENFSDIDLHVIMDYSKVDKRTEFVANYFHSLKSTWNEEHEDLKIFGFPVEVYVQDINQVHTSSGVYSLEKNNWVDEPERDKLAKVKVNKTTIRKEISKYVDKIENIINKNKKAKGDNYKLEKINQEAEKLFDDIVKNRRSSLNGKNTEITEPNIVFKYLRREGYIDKLSKIILNTYNKINSLP